MHMCFHCVLDIAAGGLGRARPGRYPFTQLHSRDDNSGFLPTRTSVGDVFVELVLKHESRRMGSVDTE